MHRNRSCCRALPDLHVMAWVLDRTDPLDVHGTSGTTDMLTSMIRAVEPDTPAA